MASQPQKSHGCVFGKPWLPGSYSNLTLNNTILIQSRPETIVIYFRDIIKTDEFVIY